MKKSKLIELLKTFTQAECRQFGDFLQSPYFNKNPEVSLMWGYLCQHHPEYPEERVKKANVFRNMFPGEEYDAKKLSYLMNYLLKLGEDFILIQQHRANEVQNTYFLMQEFMNRKLYKHFQYTYKKSRKVIEEKSTESLANYSYKYRMTELYSDFSFGKGERNEPYLQQAADEFDDFFLISKIRYACAMLTRTRVYSSDFDISFIDEISRHLEARPKVPPLIAIYFEIFKLLRSEQDNDHVQSIQKQLRLHAGSIDIKELRNFYLMLINICIQKSRQGERRDEKKYLEICFDLYNEGINREALFDDGVLSNHTYTNTVYLGMTLERYNLTERFIHDKTKFLAKSTREDAYHYNLALLAFHKAEFDDVFFELNQMPLKDPLYTTSGKILYIKLYFETRNFEPLTSLLASYSIHLRRSRNLSINRKKANLNFCNILNHILRNNPKKREKVKGMIQTLQPLTERQWLLQAWGQKI